MKSTEKIVPTIPAKDAWEKIEDWDDIPDIIRILDEFDPSELNEADQREFASRNPYETDYYRDEYDTPVQPIEHRLRMAEWCADRDRKELETLNKQFLEAVGEYMHGYEDEVMMAKAFKKVRQHLITAIGTKATAYIVRAEYDSRTPEEWDAVAAAYQDYEAVRKAEWEAAQQEKASRMYYWDEAPPASFHEKIVRIRKGWKGSNGKPLVQRDFAKMLGYPINKYAEAEKVDRYGGVEDETPVEDELLEKLVTVAHANPYWLFDPECEAYYAVDEFEEDSVQMGDEPCVYAPPDVILKWIREGKPKMTNWSDGVIWDIKSVW